MGKSILAVTLVLSGWLLTSGAHAQEFRLANHATIGGGPATDKAVFDYSWGLSLTGAWNAQGPWRLGPWGSVGSNRNTHSYASGGLMALWKSQTGTGLALLGAAGAVTPIHQDPIWKTGMTVRTALVLWYEDEGRVFSVASPTVGLGMEVRSMPGAAGYGRESEVIFQLAIDPVAAAIYIPFLIGSAIFGLPH